MKQNITIEVPEGKVAKYNEKTQTIEFVDKGPIRSKSWKEFCKNNPIVENEYFISNTSIIAKTNPGYSSTRKWDVDGNLLATREDAVGIHALIQLTRLHDEWVGDWKPNHVNTYYAIEYNGVNETIGVKAWWDTYRLLSFPTRELAIEFLECFGDLIYKAKKFI